MAKILSGEKLAKSIILKLKKEKKQGVLLAVIQVGENAVSAKYIAEKEKVAKELKVGFQRIQFPLKISQAKLEQEIKKIGEDTRVSGMIVQLPLPNSLNTQRVLDSIPKEKDVDVLSSSSFSDFALGTLPILPPTVGAIGVLLKESKVKIEGARVAVVGAGKLVGLPAALWLAQQGASISLIQKETKNASKIVSKADIVISGVGKTGLITGTMIKKGAVVIDAGTSVEGGSTKGDVDFESVSKKASFLTPVPGGVGPLTVACLFRNLYILS
jgi:methylenetetrahydrofolate dehydrogenase (NADP+) / methenyltetrahydrofolate cyclohydrolase